MGGISPDFQSKAIVLNCWHTLLSKATVLNCWLTLLSNHNYCAMLSWNMTIELTLNDKLLCM